MSILLLLRLCRRQHRSSSSATSLHSALRRHASSSSHQQRPPAASVAPVALAEMGAGCAKNVAGDPQRTAVTPFASDLRYKGPQQAQQPLAQQSRRSSAAAAQGGRRGSRPSLVPQPTAQLAAGAAARRGSKGVVRCPSSVVSISSVASGAGPGRKSEVCIPVMAASAAASPNEQQHQQQLQQKLLQKSQQQDPLPEGFNFATGQPPHHMVSGELTRISCGLLFHVRVYGMKARGLDVSSHVTTTCLRLEWAAPLSVEKAGPTSTAECPEATLPPGEGEVLVLTTQPAKGRSPKWFDSFEFTWHSPSLDHLHRRALLFSVVEVPLSPQGEAPAATLTRRVVGKGEVSLFDVAAGPVHHDVLLQDGEEVNQTGRLIMDVRMQQICDLIINPIEILAHLSDSATSSEGEEESSEEEETEETRDRDGMEGSISPRSTSSAPLGGEHERNSMRPRLMGTKSEVFCRTRSPHLHSFASRSHTFRCGERQRRQAAAAASRAARAAAAARAASVGPSEDGWAEGSGLGSASALLGRSGSISSSTSNVSLQHAQLDREDSAPREMDEEEPGPLSAHWLLSFSPTGVDNPRESFSVATENVEQPYWNAVDHALLRNRLKAPGLSGTSFVPSLGQPLQRNNLIQKREGLLERGSANHQESATAVPLKSAAATPTNCEISFSGGEKLPPAGANYRLALDRMLSLPEESPISPGGAGNKNEGTGAPTTWKTLKTQVSRRQTQRHLDHLDPESTYQKLAAIAAKGNLVKEVLHDTFPTLRLSTTIDQLRQHYLRIRLHAKVFANDTPSLFGECWLPFFKVYDADVTSMPRQFYDSYFREKLWLDGKRVGVLEGVIVFQNNPVVRQVCAGVHTEKGLCRIFPPVLGHEHRPVCFKFTGAANSVPPAISRIAALHEKLLHIITRKTQQRTPENPPASTAVTALLTSVLRTPDTDPGGTKVSRSNKTGRLLLPVFFSLGPFCIACISISRVLSLSLALVILAFRTRL